MAHLAHSAARPADIENLVQAPTLRERVVLQFFGRLACGRLTIDLPSGASVAITGAQEGPQAHVRINDLKLVSRLLAAGDLGAAESFMQGEWDSPNLTAVLHLVAANMPSLSDAISRNWLNRLMSRIRHARRANTKSGSRRNIAAHYDLGNDFFRAWLDPTMTYSSALFDDHDMSAPLASAQLRKYRRLAEKLDLQPDHHILEIGCGWGGFAEVAASEFGCRVTCLTLSREQAAYARDRMQRAGLADRVEIRIQDYRDTPGKFDRIASIEMFEAVGEKNWQTYFDVIRARLAPGGKAGLQIITIADDRFDHYRRNPDFIQSYIFPGGMLPSPTALEAAVERSGLKTLDTLYFGKSYAETLRRWDRDFRHAWETVKPLGFDERFRRMWHYYLSYCETGFDRGRIDVGQFILAPAADA